MRDSRGVVDFCHHQSVGAFGVELLCFFTNVGAKAVRVDIAGHCIGDRGSASVQTRRGIMFGASVQPAVVTCNLLMFRCAKSSNDTLHRRAPASIIQGSCFGLMLWMAKFFEFQQFCSFRQAGS